MKKMNKRGDVGEGIIMMYRLVLVTIIAFIILGIAAFVYDFDINVRYSEAAIMQKRVVNCFAPEGAVDLDKLSVVGKELFGYCEIKISDGEVGRFYVSVVVKGANGEELKKFEQGDSGIFWISDLSKKAGGNEFKKYNPGVREGNYNVFVVDGDKKIDGKMEVKIGVMRPEG